MEASPRTRTAALATGVALLAFLVFAPTIAYDFVYDDVSLILGNPWIWDAAHLGDLLTRPVWSFKDSRPSNYFRPVQTLVYFVDARLFGRHPSGFHLTNVLAGALTAAVAYLLLRRVTAPERALAAALLFAVHPAHAESVAWISGSSEVNCGLLVFATLLAATSLFAARGSRRAGWLFLTGGLFFLALMAKETAAVTPFLALALVPPPGAPGAGPESIDPSAEPPRPWRRGRLLGPALMFGFVLAAYVFLRAHVFGGLWGLNRRPELSAAEVVASALSLLPRYVLVAFLPLRLVPDRVFDPPEGLLDPWVLAGAAMLAAASALSIVTWRRAPAVTLGVLLLILPLLPVLHVQLVGVSAQADRYLFIPSLGAGLLVVEAAGALLARLEHPARRRAAIAALGVALSLSIAGSLRAASMWKDEETLCRAAIALEPRTVNMRLVLSGHYERTGREDEAWRLAAEAREIDPGDPGVSAVAMTLEARNTAASPQEEIALLRRALEVHPAHPYVWGNLSAAFLKARLHAEARDAANRSLALEPANAQVLVNLASALGGLGDPAGQEREARRALSIDPRFPLAWLNVGEASLARGDFESYATAVERAAALDPRLVRARLGLSMVAWRRGRTLDAIREANLARELAPRDPEVWAWLGVLRRAAGDDEGARRAWEQALALDPRSAAARRYLGLPEGATTPSPR